MSVRVVARIRPLLKSENEVDTIVRTAGADEKARPNVVKVPNPKNFSEQFSFQFNSVYGEDTTQQEIFDAEVAPTVKHLFLGYDVTLFAYGPTSTGKTHTMRGGKSLTDRGIIPRLLSSIYRRSRKIEKDSEGTSSVEVSMSYYEIYNDRVFDLFEAPEKRTAAGLSLREAGNGKTVVVGLTEVPCETLKEFETLYDSANANRSTSATKLNAHSSRSHAILCVKVTVTGPNETRVSTASAIDLAGSEDNRRTGNDKERMVESASINKSLFVLAQCVEAISKKQQRIPYRESKMTRILSLGQNNGFTVMILNLAPVKSFHLDTLSSLNFANRTKKIEVREVENEPIFKGPPRAVPGMPTATGPTIQRQPLRPLTAAINANIGAQQANAKGGDKPLKAFSVYSDKNKPGASNPTAQTRPAGLAHKSSPAKRGADSSMLPSSRPTKQMRPTPSFIRRAPDTHLTKATIESLVEQKVSEILAGRAPLQFSEAGPQEQSASAAKGISEEVQRRLESIEQRLEGQEGARAEGLSYLLMAKQHQVRGEDGSALKMYRLARPYFPENEKLVKKIAAMEDRIHAKREEEAPHDQSRRRNMMSENADSEDESYHDKHDTQGGSNDDFEDSDDDASFHFENRSKKAPARKVGVKKIRASSPDPLGGEQNGGLLTPRTAELLRVINSRDVSKIKLLKGVGVKRAEGIVECLQEMDDQDEALRAVAASNSSSTGVGTGTGTQVVAPVLDIACEDLVYDAKWAPHKPLVFACVTGPGELEVFDLNFDTEVPIARASPSRGKGESLLARSLNKCAWEEREGGLIATGGLDLVVRVFEVGRGLSGRGKFRGVDGSEAIEFLSNKQSRARQALGSDVLKPESLLEGQLVRLY